MKPHKWAKEIKGWADGAEIENYCESSNTWEILYHPRWYDNEKYRIKPQHKEPQYLYAYERIDNGNIQFSPRLQQTGSAFEYIGKIKLED